MTASEKVAYLKGLIEGMGIDEKSEQGKLFSVIADILEDLASDIADIEENAYDLAEEIDALSDDLADVEDMVYDYDDDDDEDDYRCSGCSSKDDEDEPIFFELTCPACDNTITVDEDVLNLGSIQCPNCGEMMEFDFDEDDEDEQDD
ncbi:MAG: hypothetical protein NC319_04750 [Butyricicoccus sp.]|nr:hypothetical protein [Butyricicoccus sp.]